MAEETEPKSAKKTAKRKMSTEAKDRIAESQRQRWAEKRAPVEPDPTVLAFRQQLVPLVEKREIIQQHVRQAQRALQEAQMTLQNDQQALQDTENAINYRLNMIAQLTGQPQPKMIHISEVASYPSGDAYARQLQRIPDAAPAYATNYAPQYAGEEVNLMGNPNIPSNITSIPAPQNQRYNSGYVPTGESNPRSESAIDVRNDPATREVMQALAEARKQMSVV